MIYRRRKSHEACNTKMSGSQCFCGWKNSRAIEKGLMVLIGVGKDDTTEVVDKYLKKLLQLRIFEDENGKTNRSLMDIGGQLLLVSQFTLYANCRHGNRPGFTDAGDPQKAEELYEYMIEKAKEQVPVVETGILEQI